MQWYECQKNVIYELYLTSLNSKYLPKLILSGTQKKIENI